MQEYIYLLTKSEISEIQYVFYDLKEALLKAQEVCLIVYRIKLRDGKATVMKIMHS